MSFTDLDFADYEIILIKKEEIMAATFKALGQEAKSLVLKGSWMKTRIQVFGGLMDDEGERIYFCCQKTYFINKSFLQNSSRLETELPYRFDIGTETSQE